jgi:hypothetical protein
VQLDRFVLAWGKLEDTFWKIDRVAELLDEARRKVVDFKSPPTTLNQIAGMQQAHRDVPLFLDAVLIYLRIFADCLANLTSQFYAGKAVPYRSFRVQAKWFTDKVPDIDPEYAHILRNQGRWFTALAGNSSERGLRDSVVHDMVRTQLLYQPGTTPDQNRVHAFIYGNASSAVNSLIPAIQNLVAELFAYLDSYVIHFSNRLEQEIGGSLLDWEDCRSSLLYTFEGELASRWLYPTLTPSRVGGAKSLGT